MMENLKKVGLIVSTADTEKCAARQFKLTPIVILGISCSMLPALFALQLALPYGYHEGYTQAGMPCRVYLESWPNYSRVKISAEPTGYVFEWEGQGKIPARTLRIRTQGQFWTFTVHKRFTCWVKR